MYLYVMLATVHCFLLTRSSQGSKQYGFWEDRLEGLENVSRVTCNASSSYLMSLILFKIFNNSNLSLVFYKAHQGVKKCSPANTSESCTYDDVTVTLRSQETFNEGETIEYRCDEYQVLLWNPGNPNILSHYLNVTGKGKNATLSLSNGKPSGITIIIISGALIILLVTCLSLSTLISKKKANRSKKRKHPVQHLKPIDQPADSFDQLSLEQPCTPPPTDPPPVLPGNGQVMKYSQPMVNCYSGTGIDSDRPTPNASVVYQEPWDNKNRSGVGFSDNIYSSAFMCRIPEPIPCH